MAIENNRKRNFNENLRDYEIDADVSVKHTSANNNTMTVDSENISLEDRSEIKCLIKKQSEKSTDKSQDGQSQGPTTRRKEHQMLLSNEKGIRDKSVSELDNLKKFDEFYKDKKNVDHEMYYYRPPRVSKNLYQVVIENIDTINTNNCYNRKLNFIQEKEGT